ncbi:alpha/beta hydrolase, partial [Mitsuaria sp. TWR114]|uniref:alpha/beta fold hydrolase n=1 Tax=Mitsuaria sp. TWR114 TaxID=2601731 RepID=UPI0011BEE7BE
ALAQAFWSQPSRETFEAYWSGVRHLYNTRPAADPEASGRTLVNLDILLHFVGGEKQDLGLLRGLEQARCPVLVMVGEDDPVCPLEDALEIHDALPPQWRQLARFPGVGHGAWRDDPTAAFAVLRKFIAE